jgi:hypothetical protein
MDCDPYGIVDDKLTIPFTPELETHLHESFYSKYALDDCPKCGGRFLSSDLSLRCERCGFTINDDEADDDETALQAPKSMFQGRITIIGPNASRYQPEIDSCAPGIGSTAQQLKNILEEYKLYRNRYVENGGRAVPDSACECAAQIYNSIQQVAIARGAKKRRLMAATLHDACEQMGFEFEKTDAAKMMQLTEYGIAGGESAIRALQTWKGISTGVDKDPTRAIIETSLLYLGELGGAIRHLSSLINLFVARAVEKNVGTSSILPSKVKGSVFLVLYKYQKNIKKMPITMNEFCVKCKIRPNTIKAFVDDVLGHISLFEDLIKMIT